MSGKKHKPVQRLIQANGGNAKNRQRGDDNAKEQIRFYVVEGIWQKIEVEPMNVVLVNGEKRK